MSDHQPTSRRPPTGSLCLGVDGGKTKTLAVVCDRTGRMKGLGRAGNSDLYDTPSDEFAVEQVLCAVDSALTQAGVTTDEIASGAFRLAGVDWPEDHAFWSAVVAERLPRLRHVTIANDGLAALRCGDLSGRGVAIVIGTGSAVAARGPDREWSSGFWLQDGLGAMHIGELGLRAVVLADLGIEPPTSLTSRLLTHFGQPSVESLLHFFTRRENGGTWEDHAKAAREVTAAAAEGDRVALAILEPLAERFADYARAAARKVGLTGTGSADSTAEPVPVTLTGSVLTAPGSPVTTALEAALARRFPAARPTVATLPPVLGAALEALADAGVTLDDGVVGRLLAGGL
ncbi:MAG TPA: BadF/BadG/BcrA/BcrD ATPase family protein [Actinopolymorphaceae bacterium]